MASVSFEDKPRGRSGRIPLSFYSPVMVDGTVPFWKVMPKNAVPTGKGNRDQQIGYWNEQKRWRMVKGQRKELDSKWHFYYLGTGPHADATFRTRLDGVFWVAVQGSKTEPTGLGNRKRNADLIKPQFAVKLPNSVYVVEESSRPASRTQSNSIDQSESRSQSRNRGSNSGTQNNSRSQSKNRNSSGSPKNEPVDIVAAVKQALQELGVAPAENNQKAKGKKKSSSGTSTPKQSATPKSSSPQMQRKQVERPVWKRVPNKEENVTVCFGPRDALRNFGDAELVAQGVQAPHYPQLAELCPSTAALLFGGEVSTRESGEDVEITFHYKLKVSKNHKDLPAFLQQVSAYAQPAEMPVISTTLNPTAADFKPMEDAVEIIDQVYDSFEA
uniref:Nucleoprotein n=1 Tax=Bat Coronavirus HlGX16 TaxID=3018833 RepID=A0AA49EEE9_9NIDO|nr:nucleocapsid phosphoprotein [Bat Coronavirus HlGX16]